MDKDMQSALKEWLRGPHNDVLSKSPVHPDIIEAIYSLFEEWKGNKELVNSLCLRLFGYYRSEGVESKVFVLQFVPSLVYSYLSAIAQGDRKDVGSIQTLLLALYNLEAGGEAQSPKVHSFRVPNIAQPSVYHDTSALAASSLTETVKRLDPGNRISVKIGPHPHLHSFNAENRLPALAALLRVYSHYLSMYSRSSLTETCMAFRRLVAQGYTRHTEGSPRIPLSSPILVQMLQILYSLTSLPITNDTFVRLHSPPPALNNSMEDGDLGGSARQTLEAVQQRVEVELVAAPLLVSAALSDSSRLSIKGMSGSPQLVNNSGSGTARAMWKSMITNASFRTKKLPDDITVAEAAAAASAAAAAAALSTASTGQSSSSGNATAAALLGSISEEGADEPASSSSGKQSFRLSELVKKKNKPKPAKSTSKTVVNNNGNISNSTQVESTATLTVHATENNGSVVINSTTSTITTSNGDGESTVHTKEELTDSRRWSNEFNGSTAV